MTGITPPDGSVEAVLLRHAAKREEALLAEVARLSAALDAMTERVEKAERERDEANIAFDGALAELSEALGMKHFTMVSAIAYVRGAVRERDEACARLSSMTERAEYAESEAAAHDAAATVYEHDIRELTARAEKAERELSEWEARHSESEVARVTADRDEWKRAAMTHTAAKVRAWAERDRALADERAAVAIAHERIAEVTAERDARPEISREDARRYVEWRDGFSPHPANVDRLEPVDDALRAHAAGSGAKPSCSMATCPGWCGVCCPDDSGAAEAVVCTYCCDHKVVPDGVSTELVPCPRCANPKVTP